MYSLHEITRGMAVSTGVILFAEGNGENGFLAEEFFGVFDNYFEDNEANENSMYGFNDKTTGGGTAGTANTYVDNECSDNGDGPSNPGGLCDDSTAASTIFSGSDEATSGDADASGKAKNNRR